MRTIGERMRALWSLAAVVMIAGLATAAWGATDSVRSVRRVTIGEGGVRIEATDDHRDDDDQVNLDIDLGAVRVRATGDDWDSYDDGENIVRVFSDIDLPAGERADDVVAVFGSVTVGGEVMGDLVAVMGSIHLLPGAVVHGDAVAVGGVLDMPAGASVRGETVSVLFAPMLFGMPPLRSMILTVMASWLVAILFGWLLMALFPARMMRVAVTASTRTGLSLLLGIMSAPLLIIAMCLLCVTIIGIPVAIVLPIAFMLAVWAGQIAAAYLVGCRLVRRGVGEGGITAPVIAGTLFVVAFFAVAAVLAGPEGTPRTIALFFTLLGSLLVTGMSVIGTGAVILSGMGSRPTDVRYERGGGAPAPVSPGLGSGAPSTPAS